MPKKKKVSKKASAEKAEPVVEEKPGVKVESEPAIVEEPTIKVRGTAMGGTKMMTPSEFAEYCKGE